MFRRAVLVALLVLGAAAAEARPYNDVQIMPEGSADSDPRWLTAQEYKQLVLELGLIVSPKVMAPSSTLGFNGFDFGFEVNTALIHGKEPYWTKGTKDGSIPRVFAVPTLRVRKGLPLSLEGGMSVSYLPFTQQQVLGGDIPGIHTGRVSAWSGFAKGYIDSKVVKGGLSSLGPVRDDFLDATDGDGIGTNGDARTREYNKWVVGVQVESGGFTYLVDSEFVDKGIPTINMRWGAQF